jgi:uncharacterized GH25 family protein
MKSSRFAFIAVVILALIPLTLSAGEKKKKAAEEHYASLSFTVVRESSGRPIKNAEVVVHWLKKDGSQSNEGFELKTDTDGHANIDNIPYGKFRLQVLVHGFQTYGDDVEINQDKQEFVIRMKPPADQVSIYK